MLNHPSIRILGFGVVCAAAFSFGGTFNVLAQEEAKAPAVAAEASEATDEAAAPSDDGDTPRYAALIERLENEAQGLEQTITSVNAALEAGIRNIDQADEVFDRMIENVRRAAEMGKRDSEFVKKIEQLTKMAREDAAAARADGDTAMVGAFEEDAQQLTQLREQALAVYNDSDRKIREIEKQKRFVVRRLRAERYDAAIAQIRQATAEFEKFNEDIGGLRDRIPQSDRQNP